MTIFFLLHPRIALTSLHSPIFIRILSCLEFKKTKHSELLSNFSMLEGNTLEFQIIVVATRIKMLEFPQLPFLFSTI